jgi:glycolate dehydrogenase FAD-linked subunit
MSQPSQTHTQSDAILEKRSLIVTELGNKLPKECLLHSPEDLAPYECDGLSIYQSTPLAVALPYTVEQAQQVVRYCHKNGIPIVPRGAGTGLSGGALPHEEGILLSLARLNAILDLDIQARTCRVQPGVRNLAISEAARPHGLYYAPDPSSQIACSIGGNIAENAGGVHCLKYGLTVHNVFEVTILTAEGELMTLGSEALDSAGYDLLALIIGSEGLLGIVVDIVVKLLPTPQEAKVILAAFHTVEEAGDAVGQIIGAGIIPGGIEMMDKLSIQATEDFVHAGYPLDAAAILLCELDGIETEINETTARVNEVLLKAGAYQVRISENDQQRELFWAGRKAAFPAVGRISPDYYCMDGTIPRKELANVLTKIGERADLHGLRVANVFHAGDGNLHPLILFDANKEGDLDRAHLLGNDILELSIAVGGTITGEHGVGIEKLGGMCSQFNAEELTQYHAIKAAFDDTGILNPGKAVPTLHRCAEFGHMHVHNGELPFPDLPRF